MVGDFRRNRETERLEINLIRQWRPDTQCGATQSYIFITYTLYRGSRSLFQKRPRSPHSVKFSLSATHNTFRFGLPTLALFPVPFTPFQNYSFLLHIVTLFDFFEYVPP